MSGKKKPEFKFDLGSEVKDTFTGFYGIVVCRCQWIHNCNTYGIQPKELKDGVPQEKQFFDEPQLTELRKDVVKPERETGGPCPSVPSTAR